MKSRLPQGFGGGPSNMNQMIRQAQKIQEEAAKVQEELEEREFKAAAGGGAVEVVMTGKKQVKALTIKPEVVDPEDVEMLQDLVIAAVNEALRTIDETSSKELEKVTGGISMPGLF